MDNNRPVTNAELMQNWAWTNNRPTWAINPLPIEHNVPPGQDTVDYTQYGGNVPDVAQNAQAATYMPFIPGPVFTAKEFNIVQWFSQRVHLSPIGGFFGK